MTLSLFLKIAASAMIPITELRATIPIFLARHPELPLWFIFTAAVIGNMIPNFFLLWFLPQLTEWLHNHMAPLINRSVLSLHDFFIKKKRMTFLYIGVICITAISVYTLYILDVKDAIWYLAILIGIPLWAKIIFLIAKKTFQAAQEEKSIIHWFYNKIHKEHGQKFYRFGAISLIFIVGIPLPGTGSWTGSLLAFLFNIPYWKALFFIFIGILIAAAIVLSISTGIISSASLI